MKTSRLNINGLLFSLGLALACSPCARAWAVPNTFDCLRDLIPLTERALIRSQRKSVEEPFIIGGKYIVFPEVAGGKIAGFFVYDRAGAWHYDAVEEKPDGERKAIADLAPDAALGVLELVAQPRGLETLTIRYLPGFNPNESVKSGPVALGVSVLPVVGAFVSRPEQKKIAYYDPGQASDADLKRWLAERSSGRRPAENQEAPLNRTIQRLVSRKGREGNALWAPLKQELELRKNWIKTHNLDEATFKSLTRIMDTTCRE
ncbi:MAG: hypothetical protein HC902_03980 [Calothrix sp. SM1_5_4]|nr:hypothetical protein [Calothrix sp. SM1_5_4]